VILRSLVLCVLVLCSGSALAVDLTRSLEPPGDKTERQTKVEVSEDSAFVQDEDTSFSEEETTPSSIERFVQPFTRWAEDQIHDTGLIRSPQVAEDKPSLRYGVMTLREAIQHATQRYPGTVLSANKVLSEETLSYQIKIISAQGVVKTIKITESHEDIKVKQ